ncbi:MAG TPA: DUF2516 family protein [Nocardioides sp.]|nr:DUF2516 family protein [Nocardioides sp.]
MGFVPGGDNLLVFTIEGWIGIAVFALLLIIKIFALVCSLLYSNESYLAADKRNKATWSVFLAVAVAIQLLPFNAPGMFLVQMGLLVAACVFLADVRPALANLRRR